MASSTKLNSDSKNTTHWPSPLKPLSLKAVLHLRNGLELSREAVSAFSATKNHQKAQPKEWIAISLN